MCVPHTCVMWKILYLGPLTNSDAYNKIFEVDDIAQDSMSIKVPHGYFLYKRDEEGHANPLTPMLTWMLDVSIGMIVWERFSIC